jgi:hypothetical protein
MRKLVVFTVLLGTLSLLSFIAEKTYTVRFTEPQIQYHWQNLEAIKQVADQSQLPHNQVKFIVNTIDSLQKDMRVNLKIDSAKTK